MFFMGVSYNHSKPLKKGRRLEENVEKVNESVAFFQRSPEGLKDIHESVQMFLSEEEKEKERFDWYEPKMSTFAKFLKDVEKWKTSQTDPQSLIVPQDSIST